MPARMTKLQGAEADDTNEHNLIVACLSLPTMHTTWSMSAMLRWLHAHSFFGVDVDISSGQGQTGNWTEVVVPKPSDSISCIAVRRLEWK